MNQHQQIGISLSGSGLVDLEAYSAKAHQLMQKICSKDAFVEDTLKVPFSKFIVPRVFRNIDSSIRLEVKQRLGSYDIKIEKEGLEQFRTWLSNKIAAASANSKALSREEKRLAAVLSKIVKGVSLHRMRKTYGSAVDDLIGVPATPFTVEKRKVLQQEIEQLKKQKYEELSNLESELYAKLRLAAAECAKKFDEKIAALERKLKES